MAEQIRLVKIIEFVHMVSRPKALKDTQGYSRILQGFQMLLLPRTDVFTPLDVGPCWYQLFIVLEFPEAGEPRKSPDFTSPKSR
jgi:hypothetical protein